MSDSSHNRLSARVDIEVLESNPLLSTATQLGQRIHLRRNAFARRAIVNAFESCCWFSLLRLSLPK